eukprot:Nk52_evm40s164 gene=Nk52_evmTU40s164
MKLFWGWLLLVVLVMGCVSLGEEVLEEGHLETEALRPEGDPLHACGREEDVEGGLGFAGSLSRWYGEAVKDTLCVHKSGGVRELNLDTLKAIVDKSKGSRKYFVVLFYGKSDSNSAVVRPIFENVAGGFPLLQFYAISVEFMSSLNLKIISYTVVSYPSIVVFKNGEVIGKFGGTRTVGDIRGFIERKTRMTACQQADPKCLAVLPLEDEQDYLLIGACVFIVITCVIQLYQYVTNKGMAQNAHEQE